jgi:hypothetical protein
VKRELANFMTLAVMFASVFFANFLLITGRDCLERHVSRIGLRDSPIRRLCDDAEKLHLEHIQRRESDRYHGHCQ